MMHTDYGVLFVEFNFDICNSISWLVQNKTFPRKLGLSAADE